MWDGTRMPEAAPHDLDAYAARAAGELEAVSDAKALEAWYRSHLAPSGTMNQFRKSIGALPVEQRKPYGAKVNAAATALKEAYDRRGELVSRLELERAIQKDAIDVSLPSRPLARGGYHPITQMIREIERVFNDMGFATFESRHAELDEYNFEYLNMPPAHPARDMQDTFYLSDRAVLRTHTSAGQIHAMRRYAPGPVRVILPGRCYRHEQVTARAESQFHQVEGLMVGPGVRLSDLKGVLLRFARRMFGEKQQIRLRGSYFPFTEPSVEVDMRCSLCGGAGCRVCKHTGWLELGGAGLVHPVVLKHGGYDPDAVRGIAFGMGIDRTFMLLHGVPDIRLLFQNDLRFLRQFG
jgi:phenylalanyl-tRNA synthetase alpha chain